MITDQKDNVLQAAGKEAAQLLDDLGASMVDAVSDNPATPYDTGNLKDSCTHKVDGLVLQVMTETAGDGKPGYGYFVHEGTSRMPGRPFLRWAMEITKAAYR